MSVLTKKMSSLADRSLAAIKWNYLGVAARIVSQLIVQVILARLLGPETFGVFALAFLVVGVGNIVVEMGLGSALVQTRNLTSEDVRYAFTWIMLVAFGIAALVVLLADSIAQLFADRRVADVARGLAPVFILQALGVVPLSLLKRDLEFKVVQGIQIMAYLLGFLVTGVGAALLGAGVWSLVAAWVAQTGIAAVLLISSKPHAWKPLFSGRNSGLQRFGRSVLLTNLANWSIENVDNFLVGRIFGPIALGAYSISYNLVRTPANHLVVTVQTVLFSASARASDNAGSLRRAYLTVVAGVSLVAFPVFIGVAVVSGTVVEALFGTRWADAAPVLLPLSLAMTLHALMAVAGPVLWGKGAAGTELKVQVWIGAALVVVLLVASRDSVVAMAWAVFVIYSLRFVGMTIALVRHIGLQIAAWLNALRGGALAGAVVAVMLLLSDAALSAVAAQIRLALELCIAGATLVWLLLWQPRLALSAELLWVVHSLADGKPRLARSFWLRRLLAAPPAGSAPHGP